MPSTASNPLRGFAARIVSLLQRARVHTIVCQLRLYCMQLLIATYDTKDYRQLPGPAALRLQSLPQGLHQKAITRFTDKLQLLESTQKDTMVCIFTSYFLHTQRAVRCQSSAAVVRRQTLAVSPLCANATSSTPEQGYRFARQPLTPQEHNDSINVQIL